MGQTVSTWGNTAAICSYDEITILHRVTLFLFAFLQENLLIYSTRGGDEKCIESYRQMIPLGRHNLEDAIKMNVKAIWSETVDWIQVSQDRLQWLVL